MSTSDRLVCISHGMMSRPSGTKIAAMSAVARSRGFDVLAPDYTSTYDPDERVKMLLELAPTANEHLVLVGSSMGAYVSLVTAPHLKPSGVFLLAPAVGMPGYEVNAPEIDTPHLALVHGWNDEVIPVANALAFAEKHKALSYIVESDHRLLSALPQILHWFADFLDQVIATESEQGTEESID